MRFFNKIVNELKKYQKSPFLREQSEFADLYEAHLDAVFNYCLFRLNNYQEAEDATAEVFERAWRKRKSFAPKRSNFKTWIFAIARNLTIDVLRQEKRRPIVDLNEDAPDKSQSIEVQIEYIEQSSHLLFLVHSLDDSEQELINLKFGAGLTNRQIGVILGKSESAIGTSLYRVMRKLRYQWDNSLLLGRTNERIQHK